MNFLKGIFENETVKKTAFGMVIKTMKEQNARYMVIELKEGDEMDMQMYTDDVLMMNRKQMDQAAQIMKEQETQIMSYQQVIEQLTGQIDKLTAENEALSADCESYKGTLDNYALYHRTGGSMVPEQPAPGPGMATRITQPKEEFEALKSENNGDSNTTA